MMVADLTDKGRLRKEAFKNMHLVSASECRILYYSKSCDNSVSDSIKEFVKDQSWVNGTIFSDSLEFPDGMEVYRTLLIGDQNERRVRFVKQNTEATTKVIVKPFFERPPGGRVLSVKGYGARSRTGRHASGLRSGCGGAARGRGG